MRTLEPIVLVPKDGANFLFLGVMLCVMSVTMFFVCVAQKEWENCIKCVFAFLFGVTLFFMNEILSKFVIES